ncbi:MAG: DUF1295 domain-containing protein [bacterium]
MFNVLVMCAVVILLYMSAFFVLATIRKNAGLVDIGWGLGFVVIAWMTYFLGHYEVLRDLPQTLILILVSLWGLRLGYHVYQRNKNKPEDFRYLNWRKTWNHYYLRSYFQIFILQGIFMFMIALPIMVINSSSNSDWSFLLYVGLVVWLIGFLFEAIGDWQLAQFIKVGKNRGHIINSGLWRYTRHPNYFGEVTLWWGVFLIAFSSTNQLLLITSPLLISFLIIKVSGIPMLEKKYNGNAEFESYKKRTSVFFPWFPKR